MLQATDGLLNTMLVDVQALPSYHSTQKYGALDVRLALDSEEKSTWTLQLRNLYPSKIDLGSAVIVLVPAAPRRETWFILLKCVELQFEGSLTIGSINLPCPLG